MLLGSLRVCEPYSDPPRCSAGIEAACVGAGAGYDARTGSWKAVRAVDPLAVEMATSPRDVCCPSLHCACLGSVERSIWLISASLRLFNSISIVFRLPYASAPRCCFAYQCSCAFIRLSFFPLFHRAVRQQLEYHRPAVAAILSANTSHAIP